jgi:alpha-galactosidase/6-phospho-beta-glucosidase family protein
MRNHEKLKKLRSLVANVNMLNRGQTPDLPREAVVETNAAISRDDAQPLASEGLPADARALVAPHVLAQEESVEAAFELDRKKAFRVFPHDLAAQKLPLCLTPVLCLMKCALKPTLMIYGSALN